MYLGVSLVGIFSLSKLPWNIFGSKINNGTRDNKKIQILKNPDAVKRIPEKV